MYARCFSLDKYANVQNETITPDKETPVPTHTMYIKSGNTTVEVVAHFIGDKTYEEVVKDTLRRKFAV
jgi:hypothetical protein